MEPNKINIDNFFKSLQNAEGQADDAMFDAIKSKLDEGKISVDDYFKQAIVNAEINAGDISFDNIKQKIDTPKTSIDSYFREALLDYNSTAAAIPFASIQDKLDKDRVVDAPFKDALQNYEGKALDEEFAVIRSKVLQLQRVANRRRYAWMLLLLLIPLSYLGYHFYNIPVTSNIVTTSETTANSAAESNKNQDLEKNNSSNTQQNNEVKVDSKDAVSNVKNEQPKSGSQTSTPIKSNVIAKANVNSNSTTTSDAIANSSNSGANTNPTQEKIQNPSAENADPSVTKSNKPEEVATPNTKNSSSASSASDAKSNAPGSNTNTNIRKPKSHYTIELMGGLALNDRYLHTDTHSAQYFATRNAADKQTTRINFGIDLIKNINKFNFGVGLHESQYGQQGSYQLTRHLADSIILWHDSTHTKIDGYFITNERDTAFHNAYNNVFNSIELPVHMSYQICKTSKWDFQTGAGIMLTYLTSAKGFMPNSISSEAIQIKNNLSSFHRFGSAVTVNMKFHYYLSKHIQLGSDLFIRTNITSIYKVNTGITELPYAFGWRLGLGYKF